MEHPQDAAEDVEESGNFEDYRDSSFKEHQKKVQELYGEGTEIYRTLNPTHSQAHIKPQYERHQESKDLIRQKMGSHLYNQMHEMLTLEIENDSDPKVRHELIRDITNGNKQMMQLC